VPSYVTGRDHHKRNTQITPDHKGIPGRVEGKISAKKQNPKKRREEEDSRPPNNIGKKSKEKG